LALWVPTKRKRGEGVRPGETREKRRRTPTGWRKEKGWGRTRACDPLYDWSTLLEEEDPGEDAKGIADRKNKRKEEVS